MRMQLGDWLRFPIRTRRRATVSAALLALLAVAIGQGVRLLGFYRDKAAAEQALAAYDFPTVRRHLAACLARWPADPAVRLLAAQAARRDGQLEEADAYLAGDTTPAGRLQALLLEVQRGRVKPHIAALIEDIDIRHPDREQILEALALGCAHVYRLDEASFWTRQLLDRFPHNPSGRLLDAQIYDTLHRRDRAIAVADRLVADFPGNDQARLYLAGLLFKTRQYTEAAEHYREVQGRRPDDAGPVLGLLATLLAREDLDAARPIVRALQEQHPNHSAALRECGQFALREQRPADAEPLLRRALDLSPYDLEIHLALARSLEQLGRTAEARQHLNRFQQIEAEMKLLEQAFEATIKTPADPLPRLEAGRICLRNRQVAEGLRWLYGVLDLVPNHAVTHRVLADYFESAGDAALAEYHRQATGS